MKGFDSEIVQKEIHFESDANKNDSPGTNKKNARRTRILGLSMGAIALIVLVIDGFIIYGSIAKYVAIKNLEKTGVVVNGKISDTNFYYDVDNYNKPDLTEFERACRVTERPVFTVDIFFRDANGVSHKVERYAYTKASSQTRGTSRRRGGVTTYTHRYEKGDKVKVAYNPNDIEGSATQIVSWKVSTGNTFIAIVVLSILGIVWTFITRIILNAAKHEKEAIKWKYFRLVLL